MTGLAEVLARLVEKQERLGPVFEEVLFDNLWDLYARDDEPAREVEKERG